MRRFIILLFIIFLATEWNCSYGQYQWIIQLKDGSSVTYDIDNIKEMRVLEKIVEPPIIPSDAIITFNASVGNSTDIDAATELGNSFVVEAVKSHGTTDTQSVVLNNYIIKYVGKDYPTMTNTSGWEYVGLQSLYNDSQTIKYWDYGHEQYDFIAYSAGKATAVYNVESKLEEGQVYFSSIDASKLSGVKDEKGKISGGAYTIKGKAEDLAKVYIADMVTVSRGDIATSDYKKDVNIRFRPLSAKIRIGFYETVPGYSVKDVVFYTDDTTPSNDGKAHLYTTGSDVFNERGACVVYYPTVDDPSTADNNQAHVSFVGSGTQSTTVDWGGLNYTIAEEGEKIGTKFLGRSSSTASFAGDPATNYYVIYMPNETGTNLNLRVDYTLESIDGSGEEIFVKGATAQIPAVYGVWKPGRAYTYLFKISDKTYYAYHLGVVNPADLFPVTFDAVVENTGDFTYETVTTFYNPSIIAYAKGEAIIAHNEFKVDNNIYFVVEGGISLTVGNNANLYSVTLEDTDDTDTIDKPAQTINEASVANAIENGGSTSPYKVTDANKWLMTVTAASGLTTISEISAADTPHGVAQIINGVKFTPSAAGTYVFEYIDTSATPSKKYYKIIKVVAAP